MRSSIIHPQVTVILISQETIHAVQRSIKIEEVLADFLTLKKKGNNLWATCPFHQEKTPSFSVAPSKGFYKCFGCDAKGDAINFLMALEGMSFSEAIRYLAQKYGIPIQETAQSEEAQEVFNEKEGLYILLEKAQQYYKDQLWQGSEGKQAGLTYLTERGFTHPIIEKFGLGYSQSAWDDFYLHAQAQGYEKELLEKSGLIIQKGSKTYDWFRGRVIFPIFHTSGKVIAFGGRTLKTDKKTPKYINSPESIIYHKGEMLYGLYQSKQSIKQQNNCYIVEGYTDVMALHMAGIENVVAAAGTSLTTGQVKLLSRFTENITFLFDGDSAGVDASIRSIDLVLEQGLNAKVIPLPPKEDPDSYAKKLGSAAFLQYLQTHTQDFITFKASALMKEAQNDITKKATAIHQVVESIAKVPDAIKRGLFLKECSQLLGVEEELLLAALHKVSQRTQQEKEKRKRLSHSTSQSTATPVPVKVPPPSTNSSLNIYEKELVYLLLKYGKMNIGEEKHLFEYLLEELKEINFENETYKALFEAFKERHEEGEVIDSGYFIKNPQHPLQSVVIDLMAEPHSISEQWMLRYHSYTTTEKDDLEKTAFKNILRLKLKLIQNLVKENQEALRSARDEKQEESLLQVHAQLKSYEVAIAKELGTVVSTL